MPAVENWCDGLCDVDVTESPKSHDHDVAPPVEVSVNATVNGAVPDVGDAVKLADGFGTVTLIVTGVAGDDPDEFVAVMVTT